VVFCVIVDLLDDWASRLRPDIYHFVPYTFRVNFIMKEFELALVSNEWNWIDCRSGQQNTENGACSSICCLNFPFNLFKDCGVCRLKKCSRLCVVCVAFVAFCGETFDLSVTMPFTDFLPQTVPLKFFIRVSHKHQQ
jgi:hypothetical protein